MRSFLLLVPVTAVVACGCDLVLKPKTKPTATQSAEAPKTESGGGSGGGGGAGFGAAQQTRQAVQRTVTANELKNLQLFIENASLASGKMPTVQEIWAAVQQEDKKLAEFIQDGTIVLTGATTREACWAYQKDADTKGGWILTNSGAERVDAATAKRWIHGQ
jgi:hypothetical protein